MEWLRLPPRFADSQFMPDTHAPAPLHDAHNHLQYPLLDTIRDDFLQSHGPTENGRLVVNGTCEADWADVRRIASSCPSILPAFGVHPWMVDTLSKSWKSQLASQWDWGGVVGEIGLDRWKSETNFPIQKDVFLWQWEESRRRRLPVTVHCLRAWGALLEIIQSNPHPVGFLLHAYGGPVEMVDTWVSLGAYFSFSASFLASDRARKLAPFRVIPTDRLLVETDAPFMPPPPELLDTAPAFAADGQQIHDPSSLAVAYEGLAKLRSLRIDDLRAEVDQNFNRLFLHPAG
jgi:TatD DNase family protein